MCPGWLLLAVPAKCQGGRIHSLATCQAVLPLCTLEGLCTSAPRLAMADTSPMGLLPV